MRLWASGSVHQRVPRRSSSADRRPHTGPRQRTRERVHLLPHPFPTYGCGRWVEPDSENKLVRVSGGTSRACFLRTGSCEQEYGISTFDSESFELELNGIAWDTSGLSFVQIPSVVLEIRFRAMYEYTMSRLSYCSFLSFASEMVNPAIPIPSCSFVRERK